MAHALRNDDEYTSELQSIARWAANKFPNLIWGVDPDSKCVRVAYVVDGMSVVVDLPPAQAKVQFVLEQAVQTLKQHCFARMGANLGTQSELWWSGALAKMVDGSKVNTLASTIVLQTGGSTDLNSWQLVFAIEVLDQEGMDYVASQFAVANEARAGIVWNPGPCFGDPPDVVLDPLLVIEHADAVFGKE